jgi:hypothetical protein
MRIRIVVLTAALAVAIPALGAEAASPASQQMTEKQRTAILKAFAEAVPELGAPEIHTYPKGAYKAEARKGDVVAEATRDGRGRVSASYTVTGGSGTARGTATSNGKGHSESRGIFGSTNDKRAAVYAAERLAQLLSSASSASPIAKTACRHCRASAKSGRRRASSPSRRRYAQAPRGKAAIVRSRWSQKLHVRVECKVTWTNIPTGERPTLSCARSSASHRTRCF